MLRIEELTKNKSNICMVFPAKGYVWLDLSLT